jgi:ADP-ribose pyrophosphatase
VLSPWVRLVTRTVSAPHLGEAQTFHSLDQADYVAVLARDSAERLAFVRQYRPALERESLELPGGLRDAGEAPEITAERELLEETGLKTTGAMSLLGCLHPDTGRLENRLWCYFTHGVEEDPSWRPEPGVARLTLTGAEVAAAAADGRFTSAIHLSVIALALMRGLMKSGAGPR